MRLYPDWKRRVVFCAAIFLIVFNPPVVKRLSFTMAFALLGAADLALHYGETRRMLQDLRRPLMVLLAAFGYYLALCCVLSMTDTDRAGIYFSHFIGSCVQFGSQAAVSLSLIRIAQPKSTESALSAIRLFRALLMPGET